MNKELEADLAQMTMYSKIGKYISNKILKYNKNASNTHRQRTFHPPPFQYLRQKKSQDTSHAGSRRSSNHSARNTIQGPPVGYYKVSHSTIDKNPRTYDFNRSVPHFNRDKYFCHESKPALKDFPDLSSVKPYTKGFVELKRAAGRSEIKGSVRRFLDDPHENRFVSLKEKQKENKLVSMDKDLPRDNRMFKNYQSAPEYNYNYAVNMKRLDTHIVPFERVDGRNGACLVSYTGISNTFNQSDSNLGQSPKISSWRKMLPRERTGLMPSYMDKNINTRSSINLLNLKTLEMNCSELRTISGKGRKKNKKEQYFMQEIENIPSVPLD